MLPKIRKKAIEASARISGKRHDDIGAKMSNRSRIKWTVIFIVMYIVFALAVSDLAPSTSWQLWVGWTMLIALSVFITWADDV